MFRKTTLVVLTLAIGILVGFALNHIPAFQSAYAQGSGQLLVQGSGRASSSSRPPGEQFTLFASNARQRSFRVVPAGQKFVLTDVMYIAQGSVRQDLALNIANADPGNQTNDILFQVQISAGKSGDVHLFSGYVIPSGHALVAFTNAGIAPDQFVSISVTGYLTAE